MANVNNIYLDLYSKYNFGAIHEIASWIEFSHFSRNVELSLPGYAVELDLPHGFKVYPSTNSNHNNPHTNDSLGNRLQHDLIVYYRTDVDPRVFYETVSTCRRLASLDAAQFVFEAVQLHFKPPRPDLPDRVVYSNSNSLLDGLALIVTRNLPGKKDIVIHYPKTGELIEAFSGDFVTVDEWLDKARHVSPSAIIQPTETERVFLEEFKVFLKLSTSK